MEKTLKNLGFLFSASGEETQVVDYLKNNAGTKIDVQLDNINNLVLSKSSGKKGKRIAFVTHMDEPSLVISGKNKDGTLNFVPVGDLTFESLLGRRVNFKNGRKGVVVLTQAYENGKKYKLSQLAIDVCGYSSSESEENFLMGCKAVLDQNLSIIGNCVTAASLKSRLAVSMLLSGFKEISNTENDVLAVFASQEELGGRGVQVLTNYLDADYIIGISLGGLKSPRGPVVLLKDKQFLYSQSLSEKIMKLSEESDICLQRELAEERSFSASKFSQSKNIPEIAVIGLPLRYEGQGFEMANLKEAKALAHLITALAEKL